MQSDEFRRFAGLLSDVMAYYRQDMSDFTQGLFWSACKPFEFEQVEEAFERHVKDAEHGRFAPKVADLARILAGTVTDRAALAWGKVHEAMSAVGAYTDVVFDDPAIHAVVEDMGGWPKLCRTEIKELGYTQHRFCEAYKAYTGRGEFAYQRRLSGDRSPDSEFAKRGLPPPKPAVVGDPVLARMVYRGGNVSGKTAIAFHALASLEAGGAKPAAARAQLQEIEQ